jgi:hypothetical protein
LAEAGIRAGTEAGGARREEWAGMAPRVMDDDDRWQRHAEREIALAIGASLAQPQMEGRQVWSLGIKELEAVGITAVTRFIQLIAERRLLEGKKLPPHWERSI